MKLRRKSPLFCEGPTPPAPPADGPRLGDSDKDRKIRRLEEEWRGMAKQNVRLVLFCKKMGVKLPSRSELVRMYPLENME